MHDDGQDAEPEHARPIISRREFLVGAGAGVAASAAAVGVTSVVQGGAKPQAVTAVPSVAGPPALVTVPQPAPVVVVVVQAQSPGAEAEKQLSLKLNGRVYKVVAQARATLADVLR